SEVKRAEIDRRNIKRRWRSRAAAPVPAAADATQNVCANATTKLAHPGMPPRNAGVDPCHAITTPSSLPLRPSAPPQPIVVAERVLSDPPGNRAAENDERSEQPDRVSEARAAGACPARHSLHGQRHDRVRRFERSLEMAGGELSGRRGAVHPHVGRAPHLRTLHLAANGACRVPHAAPWPPRAALGLAGLLADVP